MEKIRKRSLWIMFFALIGAAYSGALTYSKLTTGQCTFGATCPYFLGLPVCVYGFMGYIIVLIISIMLLAKKDQWTKGLHIIYWLSLVGALFALYFLIQELFILEPPSDGRKVTLGYPSCLYGLVTFAVIFGLARQFINRHVEDLTHKKV